MSKRFTETMKWNDMWFRDLSPEAKLVFLYWCDNCDMSGVIDLDKKRINFETGIPFERMDTILEELCSRRSSVQHEDGKIWLVNFMEHQKYDLHPANNVYFSIYSAIKRNSLLFADLEELLSTLEAPSKGLGRGKGKGIGEGIGIGKGEGKGKESYSNLQFESFWEKYPRKVGKAAALKAWSKEKPNLNACLKSIEWQIASEQWQKDAGKFIPHPATWLNQNRWLDEKPAVPDWKIQ